MPIRIIKQFIKIESAAGIVLAVATLLALLIANSPLSTEYFKIIHLKVGGLSIQHGVNDGLMVLFFFLVGLEIKKEILIGELSSLRQAIFPIAGALGGMIAPALIYFYLNPSPPTLDGWGIPMATDIAFAMAVLAIFGNRVSTSLKIFLLALAIVDDLGAVLVIALFYTLQIKLPFLAVAGAAFAGVVLLQNLKIKSYMAYFAIGLIAWIGILLSGVHATIAGVLLGLMTPLTFPVGKNRHATFSPLNDLIHFLHPWVSFGIMPVFAFCNAGISLADIPLAEVAQNSVFQGVGLGLLVGKPLGIFLFTFVAVKIQVASLPQSTTWSQILAVACLAGMGFTMSLFISSLALPTDFEVYSKTAILIGSVTAALLGALILYLASRKAPLRRG